jgi:hypothetical protein
MSTPRGWRDPLLYRDLLREGAGRVRRLEFVEMLTAMLSGSGTGPGEGWFHPAQSRYGWRWLADHHDADHDGTITQQEFPGSDELFRRLDRNRDGVLTPADFDWSDRSDQARREGPSRQWFRMLDSDGNGRISVREWQALFDRASKGKGYLTAEDLRDALPVSPPAGQPRSGPKEVPPSPLVLLQGLFSGELGSPFEGPAVGEQAPDFTLRTPDGKQTISLHGYRGKGPVVLIFGSFT